MAGNFGLSIAAWAPLANGLLSGKFTRHSDLVALAWTTSHHRWVHPLVGARTLSQLTDNLAAADLELPEEAVRRLDEASAIERGFPADMIESSRDFVYGPIHDRIAQR